MDLQNARAQQLIGRNDWELKSQEKKFRKQIGGNAPEETESNSSPDGSLLPFWEKVLNDAQKRRDHPARRAYVENFNRVYGKWIVKQNAVIRINNIIFVHGGISERFSKRKLKSINNRLRVELEDLRRAVTNYYAPRIEPFKRQILYEPDGPYWYRDFAKLGQTTFKENVDRILENLKADYMVIAHTPKVIKTEADMQLFDGRIWIIDTGISEVYRTPSMGGRLSALIIDNGEFKAWGLNNEK